MSYTSTANRPNPAAAIGALGVPAAFGAVLIAGLAVTQIIEPPIANPIGGNIPDVVEITPEVVETDAPITTSTNTSTAEPEFTTTRPETAFEFELGSTGPLGGEVTESGPLIFEVPVPRPVVPTPAPLFDPINAVPRGDPGRWITDNDYRTSWINRDYSGVAGFMLSVDANGRVTGCSITRSTGHSVLDEATCRLLERRARFEPARDSNGAAVSGSFSSQVSWNIPE